MLDSFYVVFIPSCYSFRTGFALHWSIRPVSTPPRQAESIALEGKIRSVKNAKTEALEQILEAERQSMLWEKKTQLERETQATIP